MTPYSELGRMTRHLDQLLNAEIGLEEKLCNISAEYDRQSSLTYPQIENIFALDYLLGRVYLNTHLSSSQLVETMLKPLFQWWHHRSSLALFDKTVKITRFVVEVLRMRRDAFFKQPPSNMQGFVYRIEYCHYIIGTVHNLPSLWIRQFGWIDEVVQQSDTLYMNHSETPPPLAYIHDEIFEMRSFLRNAFHKVDKEVVLLSYDSGESLPSTPTSLPSNFFEGSLYTTLERIDRMRSVFRSVFPFETLPFSIDDLLSFISVEIFCAGGQVMQCKGGEEVAIPSRIMRENLLHMSLGISKNYCMVVHMSDLPDVLSFLFNREAVIEKGEIDGSEIKWRDVHYSNDFEEYVE